MSSDITIDDLRSNYSKLGTGLIERLYGDDFLSLSGVESSDFMVERAGIGSASTVLDIGCGVGGPALHLAEKTGCTLTGIDLIEWHTEEATARAATRGLSARTHFQPGDATALDFADGSFDVAWSQDAWCHVPDKAAVVAEAARVIKPGGMLALTDWVQLGEMEPAYLAEVKSAVASPNFASPAEYVGWMEANGLTVIAQDDISDHFTARYQMMIANLKKIEAEISEQFSPRVYGIILEKNGMILRAFEDGKLGGCRFVARKA
ncbi:MAG: SAM-dependent methyltransferase [Alphaproteobacteria bacterium]|jgi:ubiquinone/menaquinone biosynthesis C-methylase UbiE